MFRCMTESNNPNYKKYDGFVIDLNIHRVIQQIFIEYSSLVRPELNIKDSIKYLLKSNIIKFNKDKWIHINDNFVNKYVNKIYQIYTKNAESAVSHYLKKISNKIIILSNIDSKYINKLFKLSKSTNKSKKNIVEDKEKDNIKTGIYKEQLYESLSDNETDKKQEKINLMDMVKHIIPLICLLTINSTESNNFIKMLNLIRDNTELYYILHNQFIIWWDKDMSSDEFDHLTDIFSKNLSLDENFNHTVEVIKDIFIQAKDDKNELSKLIDKYLIPQELEKKKNAEVSTPYKLRQEMLDTIPVEFWTTKQKVFEPCSGKGGFLIDIVHKFQTNSNLTYKEIVEECIYFSDINDTNIYINKLLLDPNNDYKLNYNLGDTLKIDIKEKWNLEGFDAIIGNPPYQNVNKNKGVGNTLWNLFVESSINKWLLKDAYLLYVHPRGWRQINNKTGLLLKNKQILYLNMNSVNKGLEIFKCATDYDYYLLKNTDVYTKTIINDYKNTIYKYLLNNNLLFIPNHDIEKVYNLVQKCDDNNFINDQSSYEPRKKWMSKQKNEEHKYPCVYSINTKNEITSVWSNTNSKGHFNITKFIFSNGNGYIKDITGKYGLTQWAYAFKCNLDDLNNIEIAFKSDDFNNIISAINLTSNKYNYRIMKTFKKDFWKDFVSN